MEQKYVKVMPDYESNGVWSKDGVMMSLRDLDLPDDSVTRRLIAWNLKWEKLEDDHMAAKEDGELPSSTKKMFAEEFSKLKKEGEKIAQYILNEKPDWEVFYTFDGKDLKKIVDPKPLWKVVNRKEKII